MTKQSNMDSEREGEEITGEGCNGGTNLPCFSLLLLLHFFYCRGILSRMDPSERKRERVEAIIGE